MAECENRPGRPHWWQVMYDDEGHFLKCRWCSQTSREPNGEIFGADPLQLAMQVWADEGMLEVGLKTTYIGPGLAEALEVIDPGAHGEGSLDVRCRDTATGREATVTVVKQDVYGRC